ncbi:hypothetical protein [Paenalcaligenes suwonensis]|uniref:hypothetical protein n=1 Tax=Paenalcaligenes suwonensis TaxID=1202713 RepID=UPI0014094901|nr:hypothetical protein [Paenalcaligenes suwonensis]NHC62589.1 hypothetical protein [Paenalcaligenes suwonensis]
MRYCLVVLLAMLVGCSSTYKASKTEQIQLTGWAESETALYLVSDSPANFAFLKTQLSPVLTFLQAPVGKQVAHLSAMIEVFSNQAATVTFYVYVPETNLSDAEKSVLLNTYGFEVFKPDSHSFVRAIPPLAEALTKTDTLYIKQWKVAEGLVARGMEAPSVMVTAFNTPLKTELRHMEGELRITPNLIESMVWAPFMLPLLPLGALSQ